jgi:hypothetical protein
LRLEARLSQEDKRNLDTIYEYFKVTGTTDADKLRQLLKACSKQISNYNASKKAVSITL